MGAKGSVPLYTYDARLEVGDSQAITRKGTLGIRVWLAYDYRFSTSLRATLFNYVRGSASYPSSESFSETFLSGSSLAASFSRTHFSSQAVQSSEVLPSPRTPISRSSF